MPRLTPIRRRDLIRRMRALGFDGPFPGGKHAYVGRRDRVVTIPNPHRKQIGVALPVGLLKQAG